MITVACLSFAAIGSVGWAVSMQLLDLAQGLPQYEETIRQKIQGFQGPGSGVLTRTGEMIQHLRDDLAPPTDPDVTPGADRTPIPVEIRAPEPTSLDLLRSVAGSLLGPLATAGIVIVLVIFMLIQREDLRDRFFGLVGSGNLHVTTEAMDDAAVRISRYLLMQFLVNLTYGIPVGVGLYFIGVPNPLLWGVLATLLRFVPYIGPLLAMAMPLALAFAVDPGWRVLLMTVGLFAVLELFSNNVVEPWLYGASTGISPVAIMMAAIFWTSLWGPVGLLLSTPLTVCLVVFGRHFPQLQFLSTMLGTESALPVEARFYQRLLATDVEEAAEIAEEFRAEGGLVRVYDQLLLPALILLEHDRHRGALDEERKKFVLAHARELADDVEEREEVLPPRPLPLLDVREDPRMPRRDGALERESRELADLVASARDEEARLRSVALQNAQSNHPAGTSRLLLQARCDQFLRSHPGTAPTPGVAGHRRAAGEVLFEDGVHSIGEFSIEETHVAPSLRPFHLRRGIPRQRAATPPRIGHASRGRRSLMAGRHARRDPPAHGQ